MRDRPLFGKTILIAEDHFAIGQELRQLIENIGGIVIGPISSEDVATEAIRLLRLDGAVLDVMLQRGTTVPIARQLNLRRVPFLLVSAYDPETLPVDLRKAPFVRKPYRPEEIWRAARRTFGDESIH